MQRNPTLFALDLTRLVFFPRADFFHHPIPNIYLGSDQSWSSRRRACSRCARRISRHSKSCALRACKRASFLGAAHKRKAVFRRRRLNGGLLSYYPARLADDIGCAVGVAADY